MGATSIGIIKNTSIHMMVIGTSFLMGCQSKQEARFKLISPTESSITFENRLVESTEFNIFNYMYFYNGGGVAVGDVNGDGLQDIFFTSNQGSNKLYLNQGDFKFQDATQAAGLDAPDGWATGVTMVDINGDSKLDIYVSYVGGYLKFNGKNKLFVNAGLNENGIPIFVDRASEFGLDLVGFSTQSSFFDFDRDGDLDMFMLNHSLHQNGTFGEARDLRFKSHPTAGDKLMRNDNGKFVDVTERSGIYSSVLGYGLGVVVSDINLDGWLDIYVGNDFHENDYLYLNKGNGMFEESLERSMNHTSRYTMGVDFADFNNDAFPDLISMDMLPEQYQRLKASAAEDNYDTYQFKAGFGYNEQYTRNSLQLNNHNGTFSEIGLLAGVAATDWSWSSFFADFDLDGNKDVFVSNGILRRSNDLDYINFISHDSIQRKMSDPMGVRQLAYVSKMPQVKIENFLFQNNGDSTFTNKALDWGLRQATYSNGAAYADFDNDGDLDLVINNVNEPASLYDNRTIYGSGGETPNYLKVQLRGAKQNSTGIGAKVFLYVDGKLQVQECMPTRGFQSSVDTRLTFGLQNALTADSILVVWNDGSCQRLENISTNQTLTVTQQDEAKEFRYTRFFSDDTEFQTASFSGLSYVHNENNYIEFDREALMPFMVSAEGPAMAVGDVNRDGLDDIFLGGAKWQKAKVLLQSRSGDFVEMKQLLIDSDSTCEDVDATFFDADQDGDLDLLVVSGGNEFVGKSPFMNPRLYLNDGMGRFNLRARLPEIFLTGSTAAVSDFDKDGDVDIFIGARSVPWRYGALPDSYLLVNNGNANFSDATMQFAPGLRQFGLVKDAQWVDLDQDQDDDLLIAAEWSPLVAFYNQDGRLSKKDMIGIEKYAGLWNVLATSDFDKDGDVDIVAGNLGLNSKLRADADSPVRLYINDFDANGTTEQILTHVVNGIEYPFNTRDELVKQLPSLKKKYLSYQKFSEAEFVDFFSSDVIRKSKLLSVNYLQNAFIENRGSEGFRISALPKMTQFSTLNAMAVADVDGDGNLDILGGGNFFRANIQMGRNDADFGQFLKGDGKGKFIAVPNSKSGLLIKGEVRAILPIKVGRSLHYAFARNNASIEMVKRSRK